MNEKWDCRFMKLAAHIASWSKDPSTKCSAIIVKNKRIVSTGYNGFATGVFDTDAFYLNRNTKYLRVVHAEINALLFAREDLTGATMYVYPLPPCSQCAAAIIQSGIKRVVTHQPTSEQLLRWGESLIEAHQMFIEADVMLEYL